MQMRWTLLLVGLPMALDLRWSLRLPSTETPGPVAKQDENRRRFRRPDVTPHTIAKHYGHTSLFGLSARQNAYPTKISYRPGVYFQAIVRYEQAA